MSVKAGTRVGNFEVSVPLGAGGMGEVYRARDSKLNRDVALKFLPQIFALDSDRLARFTREAQVLAALNHPNIAAIYGVEDDSGVRALVLELVEGPTLAERIDRGAVPVDESLTIARQIADALAAAHDQGIVHRDLKPANVKVRADGSVKVLDFGLAKLASPAEGAVEDPQRAALSPTVTSPAMTQPGLILGTAAYMSPEQARGRTVGRSADIWAFGCVLYEMLTGRRCFGGDDTTETIAAIVRDDPDWSRLPAATPDSIRRLLRRCLVKDSTQRLADIRDARLEIEDARHPPEPVVGADRSRRRERVLWSAALALFAAVAAAGFWRGSKTPVVKPPAEMHLEIATPPTTDPVSLALSPDGQRVVFVASSEGRPMLWVRSLETGASRPLRGTEGAFLPFWSPDSTSIGFFAGEKLYRVDLDGGPPRVIVAAPVGTGGTWNRDGVILYVVVPDAPIRRVSVDGGAPSTLPGAERRAPGQRFPQFLPDGRHFLYFVAETRGVYLGRLDAPERRHLLDADAAAVFAPPGEILFVREGTLFKQPFDPVRLELSGQPSAVAERVTIDARGAAAVSASNAGSVVFRTGALNRQRQLVWFDRAGREIGSVGDPDPTNPGNPSLSPDGSRLALGRTVDGNTDIWLLNLNRPVLTRFTFDQFPEIYPVWSPDGARIAYGKPVIERGFSLHIKSASEPGQPVVASNSPPGQVIPLDWSRDGRFVLCRTGDIDKGSDLIGVPIDGSSAWFPVAQTSFDERAGQLSPDGRLVAFESDESGRAEIFLQPLTTPGPKTQVSNGGGGQPRWRADGREMFYIAPDGRLMSVSVTRAADGKGIVLGTPTVLFNTRVEGVPPGGIQHTYAVSADGQRFLMNTFIEQGGSPLGLIVNRKQD